MIQERFQILSKKKLRFGSDSGLSISLDAIINMRLPRTKNPCRGIKRGSSITNVKKKNSKIIGIIEIITPTDSIEY